MCSSVVDSFRAVCFKCEIELFGVFYFFKASAHSPASCFVFVARALAGEANVRLCLLFDFANKVAAGNLLSSLLFRMHAKTAESEQQNRSNSM